jgi:hypothetical protein
MRLHVPHQETVLRFVGQKVAIPVLASTDAMTLKSEV